MLVPLAAGVARGRVPVGQHLRAEAAKSAAANMSRRGGRGRGKETTLPAWMTAGKQPAPPRQPPAAPDPQQGSGGGPGADAERCGGRQRDDEAEEGEVVAPPSKRPRAAEPEQPPHQVDQWVYLDQAGAQQGPFGTAEMRSWFSGGFFDGSLQVRPAGATEQGFAPLNSFPALAGRPQALPDSPAMPAAGGAAGPRTADTTATWGTALPDQGAAFGTSQVAAIEAGGAAQTAQGQALFLQQKLRQFEESAAAEEQGSPAAAAKPKAKPGKGKAKSGGFLGITQRF